MFIGLGGYSPQSIKKHKRQQDASAKKHRQKNKKASPVSMTTPRPEGKKAFVWDAYYMAHRLEQNLEKLEKSFQKMAALVRAGLELTKTDKDRKAMTAELRAQIPLFDQEVREIKLEGHSVFEQGFQKTLPLASDTGEVVKFEIGVYTSASLQLRNLNIDSVVSARKADSAIALAQERIDALKESLKMKTHFLALKRKTVGMEQPFFDPADDEAAPEEKASEEVVEELAEMSKSVEPLNEEINPVYASLRDVQQQKAEDLGRTHGLLIRTRG
jgi:hypothetical protein